MTTVSSATYKPILTISAVPPVLVRTFKEKDHAREFLAGNIRFGLLQYYREMEDCRKDETEGRASIQWNLGAENPELHNVTYAGTSPGAVAGLVQINAIVPLAASVGGTDSLTVSIGTAATSLRRSQPGVTMGVK